MEYNSFSKKKKWIQPKTETNRTTETKRERKSETAVKLIIGWTNTWHDFSNRNIHVHITIWFQCNCKLVKSIRYQIKIKTKHRNNHKAWPDPSSLLWMVLLKNCWIVRNNTKTSEWYILKCGSHTFVRKWREQIVQTELKMTMWQWGREQLKRS